jgi:hypothetical protein
MRLQSLVCGGWFARTGPDRAEELGGGEEFRGQCFHMQRGAVPGRVAMLDRLAAGGAPGFA